MADTKQNNTIPVGIQTEPCDYLFQLKATYMQPADDCSPNGDLDNTLVIKTEDGGAGIYYVLKTNRWTFENEADLLKLFRNFKRMLNLPETLSVQIPLHADNAWDTLSVLSKLVEAADILLHKKDYDGHGWEEIKICHQRGLQILQELNNENL